MDVEKVVRRGCEFVKFCAAAEAEAEAAAAAEADADDIGVVAACTGGPY
jgi:hypothetical protein